MTNEEVNQPVEESDTEGHAYRPGRSASLPRVGIKSDVEGAESDTEGHAAKAGRLHNPDENDTEGNLASRKF